jgi:hypothetical protein
MKKIDMKRASKCWMGLKIEEGGSEASPLHVPGGGEFF